MRFINTLAMLGPSVLALTFSGGAEAQPGDSGGAPSAPGATQPASPGVSLTFGGSATPGNPSQDTGPTDDEDKADEKEQPLPWHGSVLIFDQSFTTQTVGVGGDYITDNPVYEMSLSFRPRFYFYEDDTHSLHAGLRLEVFRELTNSDSTTDQGETQIGNTFLDAAYDAKVYSKDDWMTKVSVGPRFIFPTDKTSYRGGNRLRLGGGVKAAQALPVAGSDSTWFPSAMLQASVYYLKHINATTTSTNPDFSQERQDAGGRTVVSDQFGASAKVSHEMTTLVGAALDVTKKLHLSASYVWITQWAYGFDDAQIETTTGRTSPNRIEDPQTNRVIPWVLAGVDYDVLPELAIGVGYYNATNQIGPDGTRRNPLWSPDARFFFDVTANLDEIYSTAVGRRETKAAGGAQARQKARIDTIGQSSF